MKQLRYLLYVLALSFTFTACTNDDVDEFTPLTATSFLPGTNNANANDPVINPVLSRPEFPKIKNEETQILVYETDEGVNYCVEWNSTKRSQRYSCYQMDKATSAERTDRYIADPTKDEDQYPFEIRLTDYFPSDPFWHTGYDHGHICPSADRLYSREANIQTFYLTNMQPQLNGFNAGVWELMEEQVREWNVDAFRKKLYVCKGGTIENTDEVPNAYKTMERSGGTLIIPNYFFMAVLCHTPNDGWKAMGFWAKHEVSSTTNLYKYIVNIDELERLTGIDFFCNLPDNLEEQVERAPVSEIVGSWFDWKNE